MISVAYALSFSAALAGGASVAESGAMWQASVQAGAGQLEEDPATLIRPRVLFHHRRAHLALSAPIWMKIRDVGPQRPTSTRFQNPWNDPATYAGFVESAHLSSPDGEIELRLGSLDQVSLGSRAMVDDYAGTLDPTRPRTGARFDLRAGGVGAQTMIDSVVDPHLVAASFDLAPLALLDWDDHERLRLRVGGAFDPSAPGGRGERVVGGGLAGIDGMIFYDEGIAIDLYATAIAFGQGALAGHGGLRLEMAGELARTTDAFVLQIEGVRGSEGYTPGYFDVAYGAERWSIAGEGGAAKRDVVPPASWYLRTRVDARVGVLRAGLAASTGFRDRLQASVYLRLDGDDWSAQAVWVKRDLGAGKDFISFDDSTFALLEGTWRFWDGFFAFTTLHHGWRRDPGGPVRTVADWMVGVGYGLGEAL